MTCNFLTFSKILSNLLRTYLAFTYVIRGQLFTGLQLSIIRHLCSRTLTSRLYRCSFVNAALSSNQLAQFSVPTIAEKWILIYQIHFPRLLLQAKHIHSLSIYFLISIKISSLLPNLFSIQILVRFTPTYLYKCFELTSEQRKFSEKNTQ